MRILDTIHLSFESFRNRKSRTFLTVLGVGIGIGAVLFLVSLGYGLQKILLDRITTAESFLTLDVATPEAKVIALNDEAIDKIRKVPNVQKISPQAVMSAQISQGDLTSETVTNIVDENFFSLNGALPDIGRSFTASDSGRIVVNARVAELFKLEPDTVIGKKFKFLIFPPKNDEEVREVTSFESQREFEVVGVLDDSDSQSQVYLNRKDLPELPISEYQFIKVKVADDKSLEPAREQLINMGFLVSAISDVVDQANRIFGIIQIALGIFGVIAVVVAAISLVNTMTINLLERTQDIGVMRAIGASRRDIKNLFLIESTLIGFSGGIAGIFLGWLGSVLFNLGLRILATSLGGTPVNLFYTPLWFLGFIMAFSTFVGYISGVFPSRRASKLNPLKALRYK
ncbi:MAG: ABC transporter permease [Candidatus Saccharibacteria bacterium]